MSRSETSMRTVTEPQTSTNHHEPGPIIHSIAKAERSFRWISGFRNEPRFELAIAPGTGGPTPPDRAA